MKKTKFNNSPKKLVNSKYLLATWGANARQETNERSDIDLICFAPKISKEEILLQEEEIMESIPYKGTYLDLLVCDMTHQSLAEWAKRNATDYQAVLFSSDLQGPLELVQVFEREKQRLWDDLATRAREAWLIMSETILHPQVCGNSLFRPEKYFVGATRSWVTVAETYALLRGWEGRFTTKDVLEVVEKLLGLSPNELVYSYQKARELRNRIELGECSFIDCSSEYLQLNKTFFWVARELLEIHLPWLQNHAGIESELLSNLFETLFQQKPTVVPAPTNIHPSTQIMAQVIVAKEDSMIHKALIEGGDDWFPRIAATTNFNTSADTLHQIAFPKYDIDWWTNRNIRLWTMRHPNVARVSIDLLIKTPGLRAMDYEAARIALDRITQEKK